MDSSKRLMIDRPEGEDDPRGEIIPNQYAALNQLRNRLRDASVSREDVLAEYRQKVSNGHYLTREAAEESARRILENEAADQDYLK